MLLSAEWEPEDPHTADTLAEKIPILLALYLHIAYSNYIPTLIILFPRTFV